MIPTHQNLLSYRFFKSKRRGRRGSRPDKELQPRVNLRKFWARSEPRKRMRILRIALKPAVKAVRLGSRITSRFFRKVFENPKVRTIVGANLALLTLLSGLVRSSSVLALGVVPEMTSISLSHEIDLTTKASVVEPMKNYQKTQGFSIFHPGIDLATDVGTPVNPVMNGVVTEATWSFFGYGETVVIDHQNGYSSRYAHLSKVLARAGDKVTTETTIGLSGSSGRSTGPHLHLEIHDHGIPINPSSLLE